jgi:hypothetical protein
MTAQARDRIVGTIRKLLLGPFEEDEKLVLPGMTPVDPSDVYLTGILWPRHTTLSGEDDDGGTATAGEKGDAESVPEPTAPLFSLRKPASLGLTCRIEGTTSPFEVTLAGATYEPDIPAGKPPAGEQTWVRKPFEFVVHVGGDERRASWRQHDFVDTRGRRQSGMELYIRRRVRENALIVTASLINVHPREAGGRGRGCLYQVELAITAGTEGSGCIVAGPPAPAPSDEDVGSGLLLYRGREEFAVGHGVSASWPSPAGGRVHRVVTEWIPAQVVKAVSRDGHPSLGPLVDPKTPALAAARIGDPSLREVTLASLSSMCGLYMAWVREREREVQSLRPELFPVAGRHLDTCRKAQRRMEEGLAVLERDPTAFEAFCLANTAMHRQSVAPSKGAAAAPLVWYPFQLAFLLLSIASVVDDSHPDRGVLDLLWFPTGGGKTEAYLGLTAFAIFLRRLRGAGDEPHVDVLMRYTLRLLTVQQFQRAAALICSAELLRRESPERLGSVPVSIGLYVGEKATPNHLEKAKEALADEANGGHPTSTPRLLLSCPLCGSPLLPAQYRITSRMDILCPSAACPSKGGSLQVFTVDEDIYRERPSLVIATVDKFAQLPRKEEVGLLFGRPEGLPPALIVQDELHLISGPLGTVAGLYETCIDLLSTRNGVLPKIIGSTATIGRAAPQVRALFNRDVLQFPPPGLDVGDSFFAVTDEHAPDRLYMGVSSTGRSPKFALQAAVAACLMAAEEARNAGLSDAAVDPFWTAVAYFNSLRELGGATVLVRDDVSRQTRFYARRLGVNDRVVAGEPVEITSRVPSTQLPRILKDLERSLMDDPRKGEPIDIALASSMVSVGMDILRLGLMIVNGQPKATAEYIQATSRVGRRVPGLVLTVFNHARARDISHFEHFVNLHQTLYQRVEVTSVTPWSSRARDRALHAIFIASMRHLDPGLGDRFAADSFTTSAPLVADVRSRMLARSGSSGAGMADMQDVAAEVDQVIARWSRRAGEARSRGDRLEYWATMRPIDARPTHDHLMRAAEEPDATSNPMVWATPNSMREVEPSAFYVCWDQFHQGGPGGNTPPEPPGNPAAPGETVAAGETKKASRHGRRTAGRGKVR